MYHYDTIPWDKFTWTTCINVAHKGTGNIYSIYVQQTKKKLNSSLNILFSLRNCKYHLVSLLAVYIEKSGFAMFVYETTIHKN